jgi:hypothetical protein
VNELDKETIYRSLAMAVVLANPLMKGDVDELANDYVKIIRSFANEQPSSSH